MKKFSVLSFLLFPIMSFAVSEDASLFYQSGKIYVVVGVMSIIFIGLAVFLFRLDKRISRLEKKNDTDPKNN